MCPCWSQVLYLFYYWYIQWSMCNTCLPVSKSGHWCKLSFFLNTCFRTKLWFLLKQQMANVKTKKVFFLFFSFPRNTALTVILIRAGLGLDPEALKNLSFAVVRLAFSPCLVEAISYAIFSHILLDLPVIWGLILGYVFTFISQ